MKGRRSIALLFIVGMAWVSTGLEAQVMKPGNEPSRDFHAPLGVYVDDEYGPWTPGWQKDHFDTIQDGVDAVEEGGTVHVLAGFYYENVVIKKTLRLIGENRVRTFIDAGDTGTAIYVMPDEVVISGFTIQNSGVLWPDSGILLNTGDFHRIENNRFRNNLMGVHASDSSDNVIKGNIFEEISYQGITSSFRAGLDMLYHRTPSNSIMES
jgi:parallel beta-helix repeat protein